MTFDTPCQHFQSIWTLTDAVEPPVRLSTILQAVSMVTKLSLKEITSANRQFPLVRARTMYYGLARNMTEQPTTIIGRHCGGRDHSTVVHGNKSFCKHLGDDPQFFADVKSVENIVKSKIPAGIPFQ